MVISEGLSLFGDFGQKFVILRVYPTIIIILVKLTRLILGKRPEGQTYAT
jgi:hypothetical protein